MASYDKTISVCVITYNSSKFVLETLESVKAQSYKNIDLIISDDGSSDNTVNLCENWIERNQSRFKTTEIIKSPFNSGTVNNINRAILACKTDWIKCLAGDDALFPNYLIDIANFLSIDTYYIISCKAAVYKNDYSKANHYMDYINNCKFFDDTTSSSQQHNTLLSFSIHGSSLIVRRSLYNEIGLYDLKYPFLEDTPFALKATAAGYKIYTANCFGVKYRVSSSSIQRTHGLFLSKYQKDFYRLKRNVICPNSKGLAKIVRLMDIRITYLIFKRNRNQPNLFVCKIYSYYNFIYSQILKLLDYNKYKMLIGYSVKIKN